MLAVTDNGYGMDAETQALIFEPFFTTKKEGTGLGLSTVYGIVTQTGGIVRVYSEPGWGTTFKIYLPSVVDHPEIFIKPKVSLSDGWLSGSETILVIEDEDAVRGLVVDILRQKGYTVLAANRPQNALAIAAENPAIDLILTDVVMPETNGRLLVEELRRFLPNARTLYMSGYTNHVIVHQRVIEENAAFLQKPFSPLDLTEKVREVLG